jgi:hypothetical protein
MHGLLICALNLKRARYRKRMKNTGKGYVKLGVSGWIIVSLYIIFLVGFIVYHLMKVWG